jgi:hypothetical protein
MVESCLMLELLNYERREAPRVNQRSTLASGEAVVPTDYDDDYATCARTYAGLDISHDDLDPDRITGLLGLQPTWTQVKGRTLIRPGGKKFTPPIGLWCLSTKGVVDSRDVRRHLDWILDRLVGKDDALDRLSAEGHRKVVNCYWASAQGHGGPMVPAVMMRRLGELELELWFDFYGPY